ncbi:GNAT family N-acetyltransferase [Paenibacillus sp. D51F]
MNVQLLTPAQWSCHRDRLIRLIKSWGSGRLTGAGLAALEALQPADLEPRQLGGSRSAPAAAIAVVTTEDGKTAGAAFAREAGLEACLVAVAPPLRGRGAGSLLLKALQERWGHLSCRVAADNTASMKMCFRAGLAATSLQDGPTGKATLLFQSAAWPVAAAEAAAAHAADPPSAARPGSPASPRLRSGTAGSRPASPLIQHPGGTSRPPDASRRDDSGPTRTRHFNVIPQ